MNSTAKEILAEIKSINATMGVIRPSMLDRLCNEVNALTAEISSHYTSAARRRIWEVSAEYEFGLCDAFDAIDLGAAAAAAPGRRWPGVTGGD